MTDKEKAAAAKREYMRAWRRRNPEKVKAAQQRYWQKKYEEGTGLKANNQGRC